MKKPIFFALILSYFLATESAWSLAAVSENKPLPRKIKSNPVNGQWSGWAYWTFDKSPTRCDSAQYRFQENDQQLSRLAGAIDCSVVYMEFEPIKLEKSKGQLSLDGALVGTYADNEYSWSEPYSETVHIENSIKVEGCHMDYVERWINKEQKEIYLIESRVFKSGCK